MWQHCKLGGFFTTQRSLPRHLIQKCATGAPEGSHGIQDTIKSTLQRPSMALPLHHSLLHWESLRPPAFERSQSQVMFAPQLVLHLWLLCFFPLKKHSNAAAGSYPWTPHIRLRCPFANNSFAEFWRLNWIQLATILGFEQTQNNTLTATFCSYF